MSAERRLEAVDKPLMMATYVRRAEAGQATVQGPLRDELAATYDGETFKPCHVEGIGQIDDERRLLLPIEDERGPFQIVASEGSLELRTADAGAPATRTADHRGRLRLPRGLLITSGLGTGMRVAVIRSGVGRWTVVEASRLAVRPTHER